MWMVWKRKQKKKKPAGKDEPMDGLVNSGGKGIAPWLADWNIHQHIFCVFAKALQTPLPGWVEGREFIFFTLPFLEEDKWN